MTISRRTGWLLVAVIAAGALGKALTAYTFPSDGPGWRDIHLTIIEALGDPEPAAPTAAAFAALPVTRDLRASNGAAAAGRRTNRTGVAHAWARAAADADPRALRSWVQAPRLTTRTARNDSVYVTSRRLTFARGCPLLSAMWAVFVRTRDGRLHLERLSANCPTVPAGDSTPDS